MIAEAFDVVVVPDFAGTRARGFEARTLLFLGSWLENAGAARDYPLHVACIGEPPASVRAMAARCKAAITVHEPLRANRGPYANKLRGLEIRRRTSSVLLLDADIVVFADPSDLARLGRVIAVAHGKAQIPEGLWTRTFTAVGMAPPAHRVVDAFGQSRYPYYNGGVVYLPWGCGLREAWEHDIRAIAEHFPESDPFGAKVNRNDQFGLAVALERLRRQGTPVVPLPRGYNTLLRHVWQGLTAPAEITLFHAMHVFGRDLGGVPLRHQLRYSRAASLRRAWVAGQQPALRDVARGVWRVYEIGLRMQRIWDRQVEPVLRDLG